MQRRLMAVVGNEEIKPRDSGLEQQRRSRMSRCDTGKDAREAKAVTEHLSPDAVQVYAACGLTVAVELMWLQSWGCTRSSVTRASNGSRRRATGQAPTSTILRVVLPSAAVLLAIRASCLTLVLSFERNHEPPACALGQLHLGQESDNESFKVANAFNDGRSSRILTSTHGTAETRASVLLL